MASSTTPVRAVLIGFIPTVAVAPAHLGPITANFLEVVKGQMADAGIEYEFVAVAVEDGLAALGPKLESLHPDAVVIGNGIRSTMELTHFMEQIIEVVRTSAPQAKLLFNTRPDNSVDAVKRWFPTAAKSA